MNKLIISEINRLNELMNLPLIMEGPGDGFRKLSKYVKDVLKLTGEEVPTLRKFLEDGVLLAKEETDLRAFIKREGNEKIIQKLEEKANSLSGVEHTEAIGKVNELKALRNDVRLGDDFLKIQEWKHLDSEAKKFYGEFNGYISTESMNALNSYRQNILNKNLTDDQYIALQHACEQMGKTIDNFLAKATNINESKRKALEEGSNLSKNYGKQLHESIVNGRAPKVIKGYTKTILYTLAGLFLLAFSAGLYINACKKTWSRWVLQLGNMCDNSPFEDGGGSNNGGGEGKYD